MQIDRCCAWCYPLYIFFLFCLCVCVCFRMVSVPFNGSPTSHRTGDVFRAFHFCVFNFTSNRSPFLCAHFRFVFHLSHFARVYRVHCRLCSLFNMHLFFPVCDSTDSRSTFTLFLRLFFSSLNSLLSHQCVEFFTLSELFHRYVLRVYLISHNILLVLCILVGLLLKFLTRYWTVLFDSFYIHLL